MRKIIRIMALALAFLFVFAACDSAKKTDFTASENGGTADFYEGIEPEATEDNNETESKENAGSAEHKKVKFTMENGNTFVIELYPEYAPKTVENFVKLVSEGFYEGLTFHRVVDGFMAQGGDPEGTGSGGSKDKIYGEFASNGYKDNKLSHTRGVVSMARRSDSMNSASSQFFICYDDATFLDGDYASFGVVIEGMETVDAFLDVERTIGSDRALSRPVTPIVIEKAEVI